MTSLDEVSRVLGNLEGRWEEREKEMQQLRADFSVHVTRSLEYEEELQVVQAEVKEIREARDAAQKVQEKKAETKSDRRFWVWMTVITAISTIVASVVTVVIDYLAFRHP